MILSNTYKPRTPLIGFVTLKIDVSYLGFSSIEYLASFLRKFLIVKFIGGDTLYATGEISTRDYNKVWRTIDSLDCNVIC